MQKIELMRKAIQLSIENVANGGGPFGAVIADKKGNIVSTGINQVTSSCDPTAHAEMNAIRQLATLEKKPDGLVLYTTGEPCPMCMSAIMYAGIGEV
ncbi:MAG: nucleoside deaminase, partial [Bacteroidaceae bacterium]